MRNVLQMDHILLSFTVKFIKCTMLTNRIQPGLQKLVVSALEDLPTFRLVYLCIVMISGSLQTIKTTCLKINNQMILLYAFVHY